MDDCDDMNRGAPLFRLFVSRAILKRKTLGSRLIRLEKNSWAALKLVNHSRCYNDVLDKRKQCFADVNFSPQNGAGPSYQYSSCICEISNLLTLPFFDYESIIM